MSAPGKKIGGVKRPPPPPSCGHEVTDTRVVGYGGHADSCAKLAAGWRQRYCSSCKRWNIWIDPACSEGGREALAWVDAQGLADEDERIEAFTAFYAGWDAACTPRGGA